MNAVVKQLILKDVRLNLPIILMMTAAGLIALGLMLTSRVGFAVGGIMFITANIAGGIFIGMYCIVQERKDQSALFALSLPISVQQLQISKLPTALLIFGVPWLLLTIASSGVVFLHSGIPDGQLVYALMIQGCTLAIVSAFFSLISMSRSEVVSGFGILLLNMGFSLFMITVNQPAVSAPLRTAQIVWPDSALLTLAVELVITLVSPLIALLVLSRRRDYY